MKDQLLIIFVKNPELGKAKTRLAAGIGKEAALHVYKRLLERTKEISSGLSSDKVVFYNDFIDYQDLWPNDIYQKALQIAGDLGQKMEAAFRWAFEMGYQKVCIIGSDCYDLTTEILETAFEKLENHNAVIGPSVDGGYYLLGMTQLNSSVFKNKDWSTSSVFDSTIESFNSQNLNYFQLETLNDIDTKEDLGDWASDLINIR